MNGRVKPLRQVTRGERARFGGKCLALAGLAEKGFKVPDAVCIDSALYRDFVRRTGLLRKIHFELNRKRFEEMRWEEIWDAALRIRNMFTTAEIPGGVRDAIASVVEVAFRDAAVVVRSSAAMEDSQQASFAGLHESYVNIKGMPSIVEHIKLVWASLWSDRALLYRKELGLDVEASVMSVVVQELVAGEASGVVFSRDPDDATRAVIEAVYGLNQALVDGSVEPDRWLVDRETGSVLSHHPVERSRKMVPSPDGIRLMDLDGQAGADPPLRETDIPKILDAALKAESLFGRPQDVEWTIRAGEVYILQSRPITVASDAGDDKRTWYLTLTRSFENLKALRERIEGEIIPGMEDEAERLGEIDLDRLTDKALHEEVERRRGIHEHWKKVYWDECIPFAHGMRLFGQIYNDVMKPEDPYEFMDLLPAAPTIGLERNRRLDELAAMVREDASLAQALESRVGAAKKSKFMTMLDDYVAEFGNLTGTDRPESDAGALTIRLVIELAGRPPIEDRGRGSRRHELEQEFFDAFPEERKQFAADLLDLARASYRWRDDDNIYLRRIEAELSRAIGLLQARPGRRQVSPYPEADNAAEDRPAASRRPFDRKLRDAPSESDRSRSTGQREASSMGEHARGRLRAQARQLTGQPAGPGIATGKARVIGTGNLFEFRAGEIIVCDAIEPEMTFIVPLAAAIVERRGGMLIHGAIIAREYGIPCVTGVPDATRLIGTGDSVTVDGYLGIVVLEGPAPAVSSNR